MNALNRMTRLGIVLLTLGAAACGQDTYFTEAAQCDGVLQPQESYVDSPFDVDGDGYFDSANADCSEVYGPEDLDCDDRDDEVHPGATEVGCDLVDNDCDETTVDGDDFDSDGFLDCPDEDCDDNNAAVNPAASEICADQIDNNCSGEADEGCPAETYSGTWMVMPSVSYQCAFGLVNVSFNTVTVFDMSPAITFQAPGNQPGGMAGTVDGSGNFTVTNTLPGGCDEVYTLTGTFTSSTTFTATFTTDWVGSCGSCAYQMWNLTGTKL